MQSAVSLNGAPPPSHHATSLGSSGATTMVLNTLPTNGPSTNAPGQGMAPGGPLGAATTAGNLSPGRKRRYEDSAPVGSSPVVLKTVPPRAQPDYVRQPPLPTLGTSNAGGPPISSSSSPADPASRVPKPGFPTAQGSIMPRPLTGPLPSQPAASSSSTTTAAASAQPPQSSSEPPREPGSLMLLTLQKMETAQQQIKQRQQQSAAPPAQPSDAAAGEGGSTASQAAKEAMVVEEEEEPVEKPTLEERRQIMDDAIARIKADIETLRSEGPSGRLLQLLGERIRESDEKARTDALRHRQFLTLTTEEILKHSVEEAETSYKASVEALTEQMLDDRAHLIKKLEDCLRTGNSLEDVVVGPAPRTTARATRARVRDGDGVLEKVSNVGTLKRRRGQASAMAVLQKTLKESEIGRDLYDITADDSMQLYDSDDESDRPSIRVRVEKGCLVYGGDVQLFKNDPIIVTMARSDEQVFGTVAAIGLQEIQVKLAGDGGKRNKVISLSELGDGSVLLERAPEQPPPAATTRNSQYAWDEEYVPPRSSRRG